MKEVSASWKLSFVWSRKEEEGLLLFLRALFPKDSFLVETTRYVSFSPQIVVLLEF